MASTKFTMAAAQSTFTWGWSQQDSNLLAAPKHAAARSPVSARGLVAVERFLSAAEQMASPLSSPERAKDERHLYVVVVFVCVRKLGVDDTGWWRMSTSRVNVDGIAEDSVVHSRTLAPVSGVLWRSVRCFFPSLRFSLR